jgi:hypothetical protein
MALNRRRIPRRSMSIRREISIKQMKSIGFLTAVGPEGLEPDIFYIYLQTVENLLNMICQLKYQHTVSTLCDQGRSE